MVGNSDTWSLGTKLKWQIAAINVKTSPSVRCPSTSLASKLVEIFASHSSPVNVRLREETAGRKQIQVEVNNAKSACPAASSIEECELFFFSISGW